MLSKGIFTLLSLSLAQIESSSINTVTNRLCQSGCINSGGSNWLVSCKRSRDIQNTVQCIYYTPIWNASVTLLWLSWSKTAWWDEHNWILQPGNGLFLSHNNFNLEKKRFYCNNCISRCDTCMYVEVCHFSSKQAFMCCLDFQSENHFKMLIETPCISW